MDDIDKEMVIRAFERYHNRVYRLARRYFYSSQVAEDVVQDTFLRLLQTRQNFESEKHLEHWLICVAANICKNLIREATNHRACSFDEMADKQCSLRALQRYDEKQAHREIVALLYECLEQLPESFQEVVRLRYLEELEVGEVAQRMETSSNAIYAMLSRARSRLRATYFEKRREEGSNPCTFRN